jgi:hypothetical protein
MSTSKPRITITLEPHAYEVLKRLSAASDRPMSSAVTDFLAVALPAMERIVVVLEAAKRMPDQAREEMRESLGKAEAKLVPALLDLIDQADMFLERAGDDAESSGGRGAAERTAALGGVSTPVPVTRGSGTAKASKSKVKHG